MNYSQPQQTPQYQQPVQPGQEAPKSNVDVGGGFKAIIGLFKGIIKKPIDAAEEFYNKSDMTASIIAIAMIAGLYVIATLFNFLSVSIHCLSVSGWNSAYRLLGYTMWDVLKMSGITWVDLVQSFFFPIIWVSVMTGALIGLSILVTKVILKKGICIKQTLSLCAAVSAPLMASLTLKIIDNFIYVGAINVILFRVLIACLGLLSLLQGLNIIHKQIENRNKMLIVLAIGVAGLVITNYLLNYLVMWHCQTTFSFPM